MDLWRAVTLAEYRVHRGPSDRAGFPVEFLDQALMADLLRAVHPFQDQGRARTGIDAGRNLDGFTGRLMIDAHIAFSHHPVAGDLGDPVPACLNTDSAPAAGSLVDIHHPVLRLLENRPLGTGCRAGRLNAVKTG